MRGQHRTADAAAQTRVEAAWGSLTWLASGPLTGCGGMSAARVVIRRGYANARHAHPSCEEVLHLIRGRVRHTVGEASVLLDPGDTLVIRAGVFHNAESLGPEDAEMIVVYDAGERDFVEESAG